MLEVLSYREGEAGSRGKGQWLWKLPVVDLVDGDIKDATVPIKDVKGCQNNYGGILNRTEDVEESNSRIDKPDSLRMPTTKVEPIKGANLIKDASVPGLGHGGTLNRDDSEAIKSANGGILKHCIHGLPGGKGCFWCDPNHPDRLKRAAT